MTELGAWLLEVELLHKGGILDPAVIPHLFLIRTTHLWRGPRRARVECPACFRTLKTLRPSRDRRGGWHAVQLRGCVCKCRRPVVLVVECMPGAEGFHITACARPSDGELVHAAPRTCDIGIEKALRAINLAKITCPMCRDLYARAP